jgi:diguanylate cyclase (GGDEF)-like protein
MTKPSVKMLETKFVKELPILVQKIEQHWQFLQQGWSNDILQQLMQRLNTLNTQAELAQFAHLAQASRALLALLRTLQQRTEPPRYTERFNITQQLIELKHIADSTPHGEHHSNEISLPTVQVSPLRYAHHKLIYLFDPITQRCTELTQALNQRGYDVMIFNQLSLFSKALKQRVPAAILMDLPPPQKQQKFNGPQLILNIQKQRRNLLPVIFMSERTDMAARLIAVRARGHAFFNHPLDINALGDKLDQLTLNSQPTIHVLIVDDTGQGKVLNTPLRQLEMSVKTLTDPMRLIVALTKLQPALLLINLQLMGISALDLARAVRQQEHYSHLPIIFFSNRDAEDWQTIAPHGIVDDFIHLAMSPSKIIATLTNSLKHSEQRNHWLHTLYYRDQLTGLYNRHYLLKKLKEIDKVPHTDTPLAVIYINMYYYRGVDKLVSLAATETVILEIACLLREQLSQKDTLVRLSDRVFVIVSTHRSLEQIQNDAQAIGHQLNKQIIQLTEQRIHTKWSIGIGLYHETSVMPLSAFYDAETACAEAHDYGTNRVHLHESVQALQSEQVKQDYWVQIIHQGLENNQFYLAYQPIAALHGDAQEYYDVLLRLYSTQGQREIFAGEFMAAAEQANLMIKMDLWVLQQAIHNIAEKYSDGQVLCFFIRLSGQSIDNPELIQQIRTHLSIQSIPPTALIFDIGFEAASSSIQRTQAFIQAVHDLGCRVSLRDVDAQMDCLQLVQKLKVDFVKVAATLVQELQLYPAHLQAIETIVNHVHRLNKAVIVPFVEDAESLKLLWQYNVDYITGHFVQKPGDALDFDFSL